MLSTSTFVKIVKIEYSWNVLDMQPAAIEKVLAESNFGHNSLQKENPIPSDK